MISLIVAMSRNRVIGVDGDLPWRLPADLKRFKSLTIGKPVIMGRKTFDSLPNGALPERQNIVLTRYSALLPKGAECVSSPAAALRAAGDADEIMVIGGGEIYRLFLPKAQRVFLTRVDVEIAGDTTFPSLGAEWQCVHRESHDADERNPHAYHFEDYERAEIQVD